jgi:hypothetical protein
MLIYPVNRPLMPGVTNLIWAKRVAPTRLVGNGYEFSRAVVPSQDHETPVSGTRYFIECWKPYERMRIAVDNHGSVTAYISEGTDSVTDVGIGGAPSRRFTVSA